jgi:MFS family permease
VSEIERSDVPVGGSEAAYPPSRHSWYVVVVLMLIYVNSFLDRSILSLLVDPIRSTLHIRESQLGFLMGPAFAIFYIIAGLPLGRLADVMPRRWLVFGGQFVWSIMSVACAGSPRRSISSLSISSASASDPSFPLCLRSTSSNRTTAFATRCWSCRGSPILSPPFFSSWDSSPSSRASTESTSGERGTAPQLRSSASP